VLTLGTRRALTELIHNRINGNWFAEQYPVMCPDGNGVYTTNRYALYGAIQGVLPDLEWPPDRDETPEQDDLFDLIEFLDRRVSEPSKGQPHPFLRHHELKFDTRAGRREFAEEVNQLLARGRAMYELNPETMQVTRIGPPEVHAVLADLRPASGDDKLDELLTDARIEYLSRDRKRRQTALQKLWDAFERVKTLEPGADKKAQAEALLAHFNPDQWRDQLRGEMETLTKIGNKFQIRHFETDKTPLPDDTTVDYLFARAGSLLILLLRHTGRVV
jgi:hypothetical protein